MSVAYTYSSWDALIYYGIYCYVFVNLHKDAIYALKISMCPFFKYEN